MNVLLSQNISIDILFVSYISIYRIIDIDQSNN